MVVKSKTNHDFLQCCHANRKFRFKRTNCRHSIQQTGHIFRHSSGIWFGLKWFRIIPFVWFTLKWFETVARLSNARATMNWWYFMFSRNNKDYNRKRDCINIPFTVHNSANSVMKSQDHRLNNVYNNKKMNPSWSRDLI